MNAYLRKGAGPTVFDGIAFLWPQNANSIMYQRGDTGKDMKGKKDTNTGYKVIPPGRQDTVYNVTLTRKGNEIRLSREKAKKS